MPYKGGRRKKRRTHKPLAEPAEKIPRSLVLRRGKIDTSLTELLGDLREMMMPHTAPKLKVKKGNTLRDFVDVAGPLGVTHLMMLSQSETNVTLRVGRTPRGPTLTFRVEGYTLGRQVRAAQRKPVDINDAFDVAPLVVMHNFTNVPDSGKVAGQAGVSLGDALKLTMATFQHMFPPINPATVKLPDCRRVVMVHFNKATRCMELRHYYIRAVPVGVSRGVKKVAGGSGAKLPDLSRLDDIAQYVLSGGRTGGGDASDSEYEGDEASKVVLPADYKGKGNAAAQQSSIRLAEIGPRLSMKLLKIEQGLCEGEVLYHSLVAKTEAEAAELRARAASREAAKAERKAVQEANVARKEAVTAAKKAAREARKAAKQEAAKTAAAAGKLAEESGDEEEEGSDDEEDADGGQQDVAAEAEDDDAADGDDAADDDEEESADDDDDDQQDSDDDEEDEEEGDEGADDDGDGRDDDDVSDGEDADDAEEGDSEDDSEDDNGSEEEEDAPPAVPSAGQKRGRGQLNNNGKPARQQQSRLAPKGKAGAASKPSQPARGQAPVAKGKAPRK